jgi:hypothetical protein
MSRSKIEREKVKTQDSIEKQTYFWHPGLHPLGSFSHMRACRSSPENTQKMNLQPILNKNSSWTHTESVFDVLGFTGKLVKYTVYLSKRKYLKNIYFPSEWLPKQQTTSFWS